MSFNFKCPLCGQLIQAEDEWEGQESECPFCQKTIKITRPTSPNPYIRLEKAPQPPPQQPIYQQPTYQQPPPQQPRPPFNSHMLGAVLSTIFCCLPFGVVAIIYAANANSHYGSGQYDLAYSSAGKAKFWSRLAIFLGFLGILLSFIASFAPVLIAIINENMH